MADGTTFINIPQTGAAPEDYLVSGASSIDLLAARADFDGSGAAGDFLPALQIVDEAGQVVATTFGSAVAAGDSASVTFAPFLGGVTGTTGGGIQFDTSPQAGDWLEVTATGSGGADGNGFLFDSVGSGDLKLRTADGDIILDTTGDGAGIDVSIAGGGGFNLDNNGDGGINITDSGGQGFSVTTSGSDTGGVGFNVRDSAEFFAGVTGTGQIRFDVGGSGDFKVQLFTGNYIVNLPTSDPGVSNALWNDGGTVKVSP